MITIISIQKIQSKEQRTLEIKWFPTFAQRERERGLVSYSSTFLKGGRTREMKSEKEHWKNGWWALAGKDLWAIESKPTNSGLQGFKRNYCKVLTCAFLI